MSGTSADARAPLGATAIPGGAPQPRWLAALSSFFGGPAFPVFALTLLVLYEAVLVTLMFTPRADAGLGAFAEDFRIWCFGYDPATGRMNWGYATGMLSPPLFVAVTILWLYGSTLAGLRARPGAAWLPAGTAALLVALGVGVFALVTPRPQGGEMPFPAEALRTALPAPEIRLTDQNGVPVDVSKLRGRVVMLTSVYASCPHTCPRIMAQAKGALAELTPEERAGLQVVAVTLDPKNDTQQVLARSAGHYQLDPALWHLLTGDVAEVDRTLDRMGVARTRNPETGMIDHANLFLLIDKEGRLAYRFTLGERQQRWLVTALKLLLREDAGEADAA